MFGKIISKYFQNHKKNKVSLCTGLNVFLGSSDQGKSTFARLITWIKDNRPSGTSFKNKKYPDKTTEGIIELIEPRLGMLEGTVERVRGKKVNYYKVNGTKFKALNRQVPPEVSKLLNINDINIQNQFDKFFLLQDSPGTVARLFNEFTGLELIDKVSMEVEKRVRTFNLETKELEEKIERKEKALKKYKHLPKIKELLKKANKYDNTIIEINSDLKKVKSLLYDWYKLEKKKKKIPNLNKLRKELDTISYYKTEIANHKRDERKIQNAVNSLNALFTDKKQLKNLKEIDRLLSEIDRLYKESEELTRTIVIVQQHLGKYEQLLQSKEEHKRSQTLLEQQLIKIHKELKTCPTCGAKWKTKTLN